MKRPALTILVVFTIAASTACPGPAPQGGMTGGGSSAGAGGGISGTGGGVSGTGGGVSGTGGGVSGTGGGTSPAPDFLSGTWRLRITLDPDLLPDGGGRTLSQQAVAMVEPVQIRAADAGLWNLSARSADGGSCCSTIVLTGNPPAWPLQFPAQRFSVQEGTPITVNGFMVSALSEWRIALLQSSLFLRDAGLPIPNESVYQFGPVPAETREVMGGTEASDPARTRVSFELTRLP